MFARLSCLAFLMVMGSTGVAGVVMTLEAPGIGASQVPGVVTEDFDSFRLGPLGASTTTETAIGSLFSSSPDVQILAASQWGGAGGTGNYLLGLQGNTAEVSFDTPQGYFGLWWSGMDARDSGPNLFNGNTVTIKTANGDTFWLGFPTIRDSGALTREHFGNPSAPFQGQASHEPYAFINFFATGDGSKITSATLGGGNIESDNLSILGDLTNVRGTVIQECPDSTFTCSPLRGDFNGDDVVDLLDIDLLVKRIPLRGYFYSYDLNGDQLLNQDDLTEFLGGNIITDGNKLNGDADFDGAVTFADFLILSSNFGQRVQKWSEGDFVPNGSFRHRRVEFDDFLVLAANFGKTADSVTQVPEPHTGALLFVASSVLVCWRRTLRAKEKRRWVQCLAQEPEHLCC